MNVNLNDIVYPAANEIFNVFFQEEVLSYTSQTTPNNNDAQENNYYFLDLRHNLIYCIAKVILGQIQDYPIHPHYQQFHYDPEQKRIVLQLAEEDSDQIFAKLKKQMIQFIVSST